MIPETPVFVIAEAGVNHNGSLDRALRLVEAAARAGADAVKFQTFRADSLVTANAPKAEYQIRSTGNEGTQYDMLKALELGEREHRILHQACIDNNIEFLSTAFDEDSLDLLLDIGIRRLKVPSGEVTNGPLLLRMARTRLPVILSTGMSSLDEIQDALAVIDWGFHRECSPESLSEIRQNYSSGGLDRLKEHVSILQCTTAYPAPPESINLRAMDTLCKTFGLPVGFSDHSMGLPIAIAAVARGAVILEKHFTLDRNLPGPDHQASLEPDELTELICAIRDVTCALGDGNKAPSPAERQNVSVARRGLYVTQKFARGTIVPEDAVLARRPQGDGLSPMHYWDIVGKPASAPMVPSNVIKP